MSIAKIIPLLALIAVLYAADAKRAPKKPPKPPSQHLPGDEPDQYICSLTSYHQCKCPVMVAEANDAVIEHCRRFVGPDYLKCLGDSLREACEVVQNHDAAHPAHTCRRTCKTARCACHDGPMCRAPALTEGTE